MNVNERAQGTMTPRLVQFAGAVTWFCLLACILLLVFTFYRGKMVPRISGRCPERYGTVLPLSLLGLSLGSCHSLSRQNKIEDCCQATSSLVVGLLLAG